MKGSSSLCLLILSRLLTSPVWAQLMLTDPTWGTRSLYLQNGNPLHRVHSHSLTRAQNNVKGKVSQDIVFYFRVYKFKSVLLLRPLMVFKFVYFLVL
jgi:hypothetical protein